VSLSEHEQRILAELEESLVREDPQFAERVRSHTVYRHAGRQCKWAALGFFAGLAVLVAFYSESVPLGLVGVAAVVFERNLRRLGKASWHDLTHARRDGEPASLEHALHDTREWIRSHLFRRDR
jgi:hypothetical protein